MESDRRRDDGSATANRECAQPGGDEPAIQPQPMQLPIEVTAWSRLSTGVPQRRQSMVPMLPRGGSELTDDQVRAVTAYVWSLPCER